MRVVIADNNVQDRESKQTTMTNLGINVILATGNGSKALETIREEQPDVVIMDLILPGIDGIGILEEVNKGESPRRKPVFIIEKVEEKPLDMKKLQAMPGILVYMVKPGDELWDIARKYHTSVQEIRTINALKENQEPSPGTPLLVVKKVEGQIK